MLRNVKNFAAVVFVCSLALLLSSQSLPAQDHIVSKTVLRQALASSAAARTENIHQVETFLSSKPVEKAVEKSGLDLKEVQQAVPALNDQELARLARTTEKAQSDFAAGRLTHRELTLIIIGAVVVVVILALKA